MNKTIKQLEKVERPREKLERYTPSYLELSELIAILLRTGRKGENVLKVAKNVEKVIIKHQDNLTVDDLCKINGIGKVKAIEILACIEIGRRIFKNKNRESIVTAKDVWLRCADLYTERKEHFVCFFLDSRSQELKRELISVGTLDASLVHPREVFEPAIRNLSAKIIIAHNHPSGNLEPSAADVTVTNRLAEAGRVLGIQLVDHVIIGREGFYSMKDRGMIGSE